MTKVKLNSKMDYIFNLEEKLYEKLQESWSDVRACCFGDSIQYYNENYDYGICISVKRRNFIFDKNINLNGILSVIPTSGEFIYFDGVRKIENSDKLLISFGWIIQTVTSDLVKTLRLETGAGILDCKRALIDTGGDFNEAKDLLLTTYTYRG